MLYFVIFFQLLPFKAIQRMTYAPNNYPISISWPYQVLLTLILQLIAWKALLLELHVPDMSAEQFNERIVRVILNNSKSSVFPTVRKFGQITQNSPNFKTRVRIS